MSRVLRNAGATLLYFCLATLVAQAIMVGYAAVAWRLDRSKLVRMLAVAQG